MWGSLAICALLSTRGKLISKDEWFYRKSACLVYVYIIKQYTVSRLSWKRDKSHCSHLEWFALSWSSLQVGMLMATQKNSFCFI